MNNETLNKLRKVQEDYVNNAELLETVLDAHEKNETIFAMDKAQEMEHAERELRLKEDKQKLEAEKFEYEKKQSFWETVIKGIAAAGTFVGAAGTLLIGGAKLKQVFDQRKYVAEAYVIDGLTTLTSKTARDLLSNGTNPKL